MRLPLERVVAAARGDRPVELLLRNALIANVFTAALVPCDIAIDGGLIVGLGERPALRSVDLAGRIVCPGLIDSHFHLESSMVTPAELARAVVPHGTTTIVADPHEIANVMGVRGIELLLELSEGLPLMIFMMAPSCVPATGMETSGARLGAAEIESLLAHPRVVGLAEVMDFPGVIGGAPEVLCKLATVSSRPIDGHAPGVSGSALHAYLAAGVGSDHECTTYAEAEEKLALGMRIFLREGTAARNLAALLPVVTPTTERWCSFCTDDRHPADLHVEGHIDHLVRCAITNGLEPMIAVRLATINAALCFGLRRRGAIAPGYHADLVVLDGDLAGFHVAAVYAAGRQVAEGGEYLVQTAPARPSVVSPLPVAVDHLELTAKVPKNAGTTVRVRVIGIIPGQVLTSALEADLPVVNGTIHADPIRDILALAVVERHTGSGRVGHGFVAGLGLRRGALASSVAHDSHNIIVAGASEDDMRAAIAAIVAMGGGQAVAADRQVLAALPLPIAGLLSDLALDVVCERVAALAAAASSLGCPLRDPMMPLSFLALPVIPELRLTDHGLVDVRTYQLVPLLV